MSSCIDNASLPICLPVSPRSGGAGCPARPAPAAPRARNHCMPAPPAGWAQDAAAGMSAEGSLALLHASSRASTVRAARSPTALASRAGASPALWTLSLSSAPTQPACPAPHLVSKRLCTISHQAVHSVPSKHALNCHRSRHHRHAPLPGLVHLRRGTEGGQQLTGVEQCPPARPPAPCS